MHKIAHEAESAIYHKQLFEELRTLTPRPTDITHTTAIAAVEASVNCLASAVITITTSGKSAQMMSAYHPRCPIIAVTRAGQTARQLHLHRGVVPVLYTGRNTADWTEDVDSRINYALEVGHECEILKTGALVVIVTGWRAGSGYTNTIRVVSVPPREQKVIVVNISTKITEANDEASRPGFY